MICNKCGTNNVEGTVFCANCGNKIEQTNNSQNLQPFTQPQTQQINSQPMQQPIQPSNLNMNTTTNNNDTIME